MNEWTSTTRSRWAIPLSGLMAAVAVITTRALRSVHAPWAMFLVCPPAPFVMLAFTKVVVRVDPTGLSVAFGPLGWPVIRVRLDRIARAEAGDLRPMKWGGWGYRGGLRLMRRAAVVLRAGEALYVHLHDGRVFAVTVDDAATGADVLNRAVAARVG